MFATKKFVLFIFILCISFSIPGCINETACKVIRPFRQIPVVSATREPNGFPIPSEINKSQKKVIPRPAVSCKNAVRPLFINTYDGSGQCVHPKVLYFSKGWNGWKYWMSYTPYPYMKDKYENPSIAVSQDGKNWMVPKGIKNPLVPPPADVGRGGHNSDPELVMNGNRMELWYRCNPARKTGRKADGSINLIYRITSQNGVKWSSPELLFHGNYQYLSPAIINSNGTYYVWFSGKHGLYFMKSVGRNKWSVPAVTDLSIRNFSIWHQDIIKTARGYEAVFCAYRNGDFNKNNQCLYYSVSKDGLHFSKPVLLLSPTKNKRRLDNRMIYRSTIVAVEGATKLYYSAMNNSTQWNIFLTEIKYR